MEFYNLRGGKERILDDIHNDPCNAWRGKGKLGITHA